MRHNFIARLAAGQSHLRDALLAFALLLVILLGAGYGIYSRLVDRVELQTRQTLDHLADIQGSAISSWVNERLGDAGAISFGRLMGEHMQQWVAQGSPPGTARDSLFNQLHAIKNAYAYLDVAVVDPEGRVHLSTQGAQSDVPFSRIAQETMQRALAQNAPVISTIHGSNEGASVAEIAAPLTDPLADPGTQGTPFVLLLRVDAREQLNAFIRATPEINTHTEARLAEIIDGRVMTLTASDNATDYSGFGEFPIAPEALLTAARERISLELNLPQGERYAAVRSIEDTPWFLIEMIDREASSTYLHRLAWMIGLAAISVLALGGSVLGMWVRKRESEMRLRALQAAIEKTQLQRRFDYLSRYANDMIILTGSDGRTIEVNEKTLQLLGRDRESVIGQPLDMLFLPECRPTVAQALQRLRNIGEARFEVSQRGKLGTILNFEASARAIGRDKNMLIQFIFRDVSERRATEAELRESRKRIDAILNALQDIVCSFAPDLSRMIYVNRAVQEVLGYPPQAFEANPRLWLDCTHPDDRAMCESVLAALTPEAPLFDFETRVHTRAGQQRWLHARGRLELDTHGNALRIDCIATDITRRKEAERKVQELAYYDNVTGLPNRALLQDRLAQAMSMAARSGRRVALLFMDLDNFKNINDSLGHQVGDELLRGIASRLLQCVRVEDTVARIGGDEFLIVLPDLERPGQAVAVAEKILAAAAHPFDVAGNAIHSTISIGIANFPEDATDLHELIRHADSALYQAKSLGRNNFQFFTPELNRQILRTSDIERRLRHAIEENLLSLWYQPQVDAQTGRLAGAEALARWCKDGRELMAPSEFIPVAEERGLISRVGEWALREACRQCRQWQDQGLDPVPIAVNVSPTQFQQKGFADLVRSVLEESGLAPHLLELEITESALMRRAPQTTNLTGRLREMGVRISIDDFGTGYSSLAQLRHFPIDKIKIDRSFITDMKHNSSITRAIVDLAHSLQLRVVAEGVESQAQLDRLRSFGCDQIQGYYFSSALSPTAFADLLADRSRFVDRTVTMPG